MRKLSLFFLVVFFIHTVSAQTDVPKISGMYAGISFERFVKNIQEDTPYRFIYRESDVVDIKVSLQVQEAPLKTVLDEIFGGSTLRYFIDEENQVWISKDTRLVLNLPTDYFAIQERQSIDGNSTDTLDAFAKNKRYIIGNSSQSQSSTTATLSGTIYTMETGEPMIGAVVLEKVGYKQIVTGKNGSYTLTLEKGRHTIYIQNIGGFQEQRLIDLKGDGILDMKIAENILSLDEIVVSSGAFSNVNKLDMGVQSITIADVKKLPAVLGEVDILRGVLIMPGVNTVGEASAGFNVRGGTTDQNLILYDHSTIFNPTHVFGFFSAFNPDMVTGVELYKGSIPVNYGGRLSSVLQVDPKFGRTDKIGGSGGIGIMTSRLSLEGPIGKKTTFIVGGRTTYSNWALDLLDDDAELNGSKVSFYDVNANIKHQINEKNIIRFTGYASKDNFQFDLDTTYSYQNLNLGLSWTHFFNDQLEAIVVIGSDSYEFNIEGQDNPLNAYEFGFDVNQLHFRADFEYRKNEKHIMKFGAHAIQYKLDPGSIRPYGDESIVIEKSIDTENAREVSLYFGDEYTLSEKFSISYGGRYMIYQMLGPATISQYTPDQPITEANLVGEIAYRQDKVIKTYHGPEFRFAARYSLTNKSSVKFSVNTMRQNIHLLSNSSSISPTDSWKLSDPYIKPQNGGQASLGYYRNLAQNKIELSGEIYYRYMNNLLDYRSGALLILNDKIEQDVLNSTGKAYGLELLIKKKTGSFQGSLAYTYSRSLLKTSDQPSVEKINGGSFYPSNYDQPHHVVLAANYELSKRVNTSLSANYSTGRPVTLPIAKFEYAGSERVYFSDRNAYRIPDYFRIDFSINFEGSHKVKKLAHSSWSMGVYNVLGRSNPYSVYYTPVDGKLKGYQLSIFARPIPFITYNFRF